MFLAIYSLTLLAIGFGIGRIHNKAKVEAKIAAAVKTAVADLNRFQTYVKNTKI